MASRPAKRHCSGYEPESVSSLGETDVDQDVFSFLWTINNCSTMIELGEVESPIFRGGPKSNYDWQLKMYPNEESKDCISLYLWLIKKGTEDSKDAFKVHFKFAIWNADGRLIKERESTIHEFRKRWDNWGFARYCKSADLLHQESKLVGDTAKIHCKIWIYGKMKQTLQNGSGAKLNPEERIRMSKDEIIKDLQSAPAGRWWPDPAEYISGCWEPEPATSSRRIFRSPLSASGKFKTKPLVAGSGSRRLA